MPFKGLAFFAHVKKKHRYKITAPKVMVFYTSPCIFIVFKNFQIRFILHAKLKVFYINVKVTYISKF